MAYIQYLLLLSKGVQFAALETKLSAESCDCKNKSKKPFLFRLLLNNFTALHFCFFNSNRVIFKISRF